MRLRPREKNLGLFIKNLPLAAKARVYGGFINPLLWRLELRNGVLSQPTTWHHHNSPTICEHTASVSAFLRMKSHICWERRAAPKPPDTSGSPVNRDSARRSLVKRCFNDRSA